MAVPSEQAWLFWEVRPDDVDLDRDADYVIARVVEHGTLADVRWLLARYGVDRVHAFFRDAGHTDLSDRTIAFWRAFFRAENEQWATPPAWRRNSSVPWPA